MSGFQRAQCRFRPGLFAHRCAAGRRRVAGFRAKGLDVVRDDGAVVLFAGSHLARREEAARFDDISRADVGPGIEVRPIRCIMGPHHLNEVFFTDVRVTEADVLGEVDSGWKVVQEVLAFERVGIARYARCERLLAAAPAVFGPSWEDLPEELRGRWVRMMAHCRRARLLAYRVSRCKTRVGYVLPTPRPIASP